MVQYTKTGKISPIGNHEIYQMATKYIYIPNSGKIDPMDPPKFTQIWIFGLKICHLATL
jgi:hypothetical protein